MSNKSSVTIDGKWPEKNLETVEVCPMCQSNKRVLSYCNVKDWAFNCAPGDWNYWRCEDCSSIYLNPRPTKESIGVAYGKYYTHVGAKMGFFAKNTLIEKIKNECIYQRYKIHQTPRFDKHPLLGVLLSPLSLLTSETFPVGSVSSTKIGTLLDVGCGGGDFMRKAKSMNWDVTGIELDEKAVEVGRANGLNVIHGSYEDLPKIDTKFDVVVCSHVIEHVYEPNELIKLMFDLVCPGGALYIALPNEQSLLLKWFGIYWRGLEAPRHICLPSLSVLIKTINKLPISSIAVCPSAYYTYSESVRLKTGRVSLITKLINKLIVIVTSIVPLSYKQDMIQLKITKR